MDALLSSQSEHKPDEDLFGEVHSDLPALPLKRGDAQPLAKLADEAPSPPAAEARALVLSDFVPPKADFTEKLVRIAYRLGVGGATLTAPFRKPARPRLLATVESPLAGDRAAGMALAAPAGLAS